MLSRVSTAAPGDHLPLRTARFFLLSDYLEGFLPRRLDGTTAGRSFALPLLHVPLHRQGVCTHASSGPSRVRRSLFDARLGDSISMATSVCFFTFGTERACLLQVRISSISPLHSTLSSRSPVTCQASLLVHSSVFRSVLRVFRPFVLSQLYAL